jgi:hypothetical protein
MTTNAEPFSKHLSIALLEFHSIRYPATLQLINFSLSQASSTPSSASDKSAGYMQIPQNPTNTPSSTSATVAEVKLPIKGIYLLSAKYAI